MVIHPLADDSAIDRYTPPDPYRPELYTDAARVVREYGGEYWIVGVTVTTMFETAWALRGYQQMLMDLLVDQDLADRILEIPYRYHLAEAQKLVELGVGRPDIGIGLFEVRLLGETVAAGIHRPGGVALALHIGGGDLEPPDADADEAEEHRCGDEPEADSPRCAPRHGGGVVVVVPGLLVHGRCSLCHIMPAA
jgi:hypothetical protein